MHNERQSGERRYLSEESMAQLKPTSDIGGIAAIDSGE
jgi:putative transposase